LNASNEKRDDLVITRKKSEIDIDWGFSIKMREHKKKGRKVIV